MAGAIPGFIGVYMAGHILEVTKSWGAVFNQTAAVSVVGWVVYTIFGTGKQIIWGEPVRHNIFLQEKQSKWNGWQELVE